MLPYPLYNLRKGKKCTEGDIKPTGSKKWEKEDEERRRWETQEPSTSSKLNTLVYMTAKAQMLDFDFFHIYLNEDKDY
jgi:hypothetical protein